MYFIENINYIFFYLNFIKILTIKQMFDTIILNKKTKLGDDNIEQFTSRRM